jgi:hypothetical protein
MQSCAAGLVVLSDKPGFADILKVKLELGQSFTKKTSSDVNGCNLIQSQM